MTVLVAFEAVVAALILTVYGTLLVAVLWFVRDWAHERYRVWRMRRSGARKRLAPARPDGVLILAATWVMDDDGNVIDSHGNSWTVTG